MQTYQAEQIIECVITEQLAPHTDITLVSFEHEQQGEHLIIRAEVNTTAPVSEALAEELSQALRDGLDQPLTLRIIAVPVQQLEIQQP